MGARRIGIGSLDGQQLRFNWDDDHELLVIDDQYGTRSFDRGCAHLLMTFLQDKLGYAAPRGFVPDKPERMRLSSEGLRDDASIDFNELANGLGPITKG